MQAVCLHDQHHILSMQTWFWCCKLPQSSTYSITRTWIIMSSNQLFPDVGWMLTTSCSSRAARVAGLRVQAAVLRPSRAWAWLLGVMEGSTANSNSSRVVSVGT